MRKTSTQVLLALGLAACGKGRDAAPGGIPPPQVKAPTVMYDGEDLKAQVKVYKGKRILMLQRGGKTIIQVPIDEIPTPTDESAVEAAPDPCECERKVCDPMC